MEKMIVIISLMISSITSSHAVGFSIGKPGVPFAAGSQFAFNAITDIPKLITVVVYIQNTENSPNPIARCSGVLIDKKKVLTAKHCFDDADISKYVRVYLYTSNKVVYKFNKHQNKQQVYDINEPYENISNNTASPVLDPKYEEISAVAYGVPDADIEVLQLMQVPQIIANLPAEYPHQNIAPDWYKIPIISHTDVRSAFSPRNLSQGRPYNLFAETARIDNPSLLFTGYGGGFAAFTTPEYDGVRDLAFMGLSTGAQTEWLYAGMVTVNHEYSENENMLQIFFLQTSIDSSNSNHYINDHGDSGGPLFQVNNGNLFKPLYLVGLVVGYSRLPYLNNTGYLIDLFQVFTNDTINNYINRKI